MAYLKIYKDNFLHNLSLAAAKTASMEKVAIVLKDNAYGHGLELIAPLTAHAGIKHAVVRNEKEALKIKDLFATILLLNPAARLLPPHLHQSANSMEQLRILPKGSSVELKVDTGMHRNGLQPAQIDEALALIEQKGLRLKGIFTHYRSADILSSEHFWQKQNFAAIKNKYARTGVRFHSANSAALFRDGDFDEDIARVGIAAYGYIDYEPGLEKPPLQPVMQLWAKKIATSNLQKGQRIGYGGIFAAPRECTVSTYDAGYADGVFRSNPGDPITLANGEKVLGKVSMDSLSAYGNSEELCIFDDASVLAKHFNTISYEILVSMKEGCERIVV